MKKGIILGTLIFLVSSICFALEVDVKEIKNVDKTIDFVNYTGPQTNFPPETIKGIGKIMSADLKAGKPIGKYYNAFTVTHIVDPKEKEKLDADIIFITQYAQFYHINSIRLVIAGYLEAQYGYSTDNAANLAFFLTVYNAVYRGNIEYYKSKYKTAVSGNLNVKSVGIAINYKEWPGATQIVIPLTEQTSGSSTMDTTAISDKNVIDTLKNQDDKAITERTDLVKIKEDEVKKQQEQLEKDKKALEDAKNQITTDETKITDTKDTITKIETDINTAKDQIDKITDPEEKAKKDAEIKKAEEDLAKQKADLKAQEENLAKKQEDVKKTEDTITKTENKITDKQNEIAKDKTEIATDKKVIDIKNDPEKAAAELAKKEEELKKAQEKITSLESDKKTLAGKFYYLKVDEFLTSGHYHSTMYIIDAATGTVLQKSPDSNISGRDYSINTDGVVVITHKGPSDENNYLSLLDLQTLTIKFTSKDFVLYRSFVEVKDNLIYVIIKVDKNYYLGKFNNKMELLKRSKDAVDPNSYITFYNDRIYINSAVKSILALKLDDLSLIETIVPK